jgi:hypothetical protein
LLVFMASGQSTQKGGARHSPNAAAIAVFQSVLPQRAVRVG